MIYKRYRYRIYPTKVQVEQLTRHFGAVRYVYNWALKTKISAWEESKERLGKFDLIKKMVVHKGQETWLYDTYSDALSSSILNLDKAFNNFFAGRKGYPNYKKKSNAQSFSYTQSTSVRARSFVRFNSSSIFVPKVGEVKAALTRKFDGMPKSIVIIKTPTNKYYASCLIAINAELPAKPTSTECDAIGIDLGIKSFAVLSTGEVIDNPRHLNKSTKALRRASRSHSKKKKGSKSREKSRKKLARLHEKVANQRKDFLHKVTTRLVRENQTVCIENLSVKNIAKMPTLARHIYDAGFGEFRRQLTYKADWYGVNLKVIDRFAPSSRMCTCGIKNTELTLKQRSWTCAACGTTHDRDLLAAQNIVRFAFHPETVVKKKIGRGTPELTPVETLAVAGR